MSQTREALHDQLEQIRVEGERALSVSQDLEQLHAAEQAYTGRRSVLAALGRTVGQLPPEERGAVGAALQAVRQGLQAHAERRREHLEREREAALLDAERIDVTLPGRAPARGGRHPVTQTMQRVTDIFVGLGYQLAEGPEVETDWYNFTALNMPPEHPARSMHDTLYLDGHVEGGQSWVLRTHTSPVQVRTLLANTPPVFVVAPGRTYRSDTPDATHLPVFHQVEGLAVARGLTMGDLKGTLLAFVRAYFGPDHEIRLRPSYFPFTEPSAEVDMSCTTCEGTGTVCGSTCKVCRGEGWIEILGCGMVHPSVLRACGQDPERVSGFAFGMGVERLFLLRSGLTDVRALIEADTAWLAQAGAAA